MTARAILTARAANRATLARQLLLERSSTPVAAAVEHLVGLQAQVPANPYVALWSRLDPFVPEDLAQLLLDRKLVRIVLMRATLHLVVAADALAVRPLMQPVLDAELKRHPDHAPKLEGVDLAPVLAAARKMLSEPLTGPALRAALAAKFPELDPYALAAACRNNLALVQVPPRGLWERSGQVTLATAEAWLGRPLTKRPSIDALVLRYFAAFGPATVADAAAWSRLTGMREVVERVRPQLRVFRDEQGRELFDAPAAPRPDPDTPAPVRFLPEYDNVLLAYADRSRFVPERTRTQPATLAPPRLGSGSLLVDGCFAGFWFPHIDRKAGTMELEVRVLASVPKSSWRALDREGKALLALYAGVSKRSSDVPTREVRITRA